MNKNRRGQASGVRMASIAVHILKKSDEKERLKAAEHLWKYLGLESDSTNTTIQTPVFIKDDLDDFFQEEDTASNQLVTKDVIQWQNLMMESPTHLFTYAL